MGLVTSMVVRLETVSTDRECTQYLYADFLRQLLHHACSWTTHPPLPPPRFSIGPDDIPQNESQPTPPWLTVDGNIISDDLLMFFNNSTAAQDADWIDSVWDVSLGVFVQNASDSFHSN